MKTPDEITDALLASTWADTDRPKIPAEVLAAARDGREIPPNPARSRWDGRKLNGKRKAGAK